MYKLTFLDGSRPSHWLIDDITNVGSHLRNNLVINAVGMEDTHATISITDGEYFISPASDGSIKVNNDRINSIYQLQKDDIIELGSQKLRFIYVPASNKTMAISDSKSVDATISYWQVDFISSSDGQSLQVTDNLSIGRDSKSNFVLNDADVSRSHAKLLLSNNFELSIQDLNSANGTLLNGKPVKHSPLKMGDRITIAKKYHFVVAGLVGDVNQAVSSSSESSYDATRYQPAITEAIKSRDNVSSKSVLGVDSHGLDAHSEQLGLFEIKESTASTTLHQHSLLGDSAPPTILLSNSSVVSMLSVGVLVLGVLGVVFLFTT